MIVLTSGDPMERLWLVIRLHAWRLLHQPHTLQKSIDNSLICRWDEVTRVHLEFRIIQLMVGMITACQVTSRFILSVYWTGDYVWTLGIEDRMDMKSLVIAVTYKSILFYVNYSSYKSRLNPKSKIIHYTFYVGFLHLQDSSF